MKWLLVLLAVAVAAEEKVKFHGYHSFVVDEVSSDEVSIINSLCDTDQRMNQIVLMNDFLAPGMEAFLLVAPEHVQYVENTFAKFNIPYNVIGTDYQEQIDLVDEANALAKENWLADKARGNVRAPAFYMTNAEINAWIKELADSNAHVGSQMIGSSIEGREIHQINIDGTTVSNPKHVYINGGIHAREWISPSTMIYIAHNVATASGGDWQRMRENYVWHIPPVINPDGYEYTHTTNRNWRKNRRNNSGSACFGVDQNRNWSQYFGGTGSSGEPCSDTYRGTSALSEPENAAVAAAVRSIGGANIVLYMDVHSYSQYWLVPWGGNNAKPPLYNDLKAGGDAAAVAIRGVNGLNFLVGTPPDILYVAAGGALDWGHATAYGNVKYSYSPELRPATAGQGGFVIPASNIYPSGEEIFAGTVANIDFAASNP